jgi:hypothetical protein
MDAQYRRPLLERMKWSDLVMIQKLHNKMKWSKKMLTIFVGKKSGTITHCQQLGRKLIVKVGITQN